MADVAETVISAPAKAGCLKELLLGIMLGAFVLFLLFYFFGQRCDPCQDDVKGFFDGGVSQNDTTIIRDADGGLLALRPDGPGEKTTYTDDAGKTRNVICHTALYCVEECPDCGDTCEGCVQENERCGYGVGSLTALRPDQEFYGECCEGMACLDGYCKRDQCVDDDNLCGYGPTKTYSMLTNNPAYYGECCGDSQCIEGYCKPPEQECNDQGDSCGYGQTAATTTYPQNASFLGSCCEGLACMDGKCAERTDGCNDKGEFCGYGPTTYTNNYQNPTYYGDCCGDYQCLNGYCTPPTQTCVKTGSTCGYGQQYATTAAPTNANYYGTCCDGDVCIDGKCTPQSGCNEQGETCAVGQISCCEGLMCSDNRCVTQCVDTGSKCSYDNDCCEGYCSDGVCTTACIEAEGASCWPGVRDCCSGLMCTNGKCLVPCEKTGGKCGKDSDCCDGYECLDGYCRESESCQTSGQCSDVSDCCDGYYCNDNGYCAQEGCWDSDGADYYTAGTATGSYQGDYGSYDDYCSDDWHLVEYICAAGTSGVASAEITCPYRCLDGACYQQ